MKIKNLIATFYFEKENAPRTYIDKFEEIFPKRFNRPFNPQPIPNDAPATIPRITLNSENGLENVVISQINMQYTVNFNNEVDNIEGVIDEYKDEILSIFKSIKNTINKNAYYFGISSVIETESQNPIEEIKQKYLKELKDDICELNIRYGRKEREKYYINYIINNAREVTGNFTLQEGENEINLEIISTSRLQETRHCIQKTIDINDKLAFNNDEEYRTSEIEISNIIDMLKSKIIEEGV